METMRRFSRRTFVAWVGGAGAGFYLFGRLPGMSAPTALAQIPGGTLDPTPVPKFQTPLLIPPVMPKAGTIDRRGSTIDYYEISMKQFAQQILPASLEGFQNAGSCCGAVVFVDQSAESVAAFDFSAARWLVGVCRVGREQRESAVRALGVVMRRVAAEHVLEVAAAEDQQPVEAFGADRPHEALGVGVRLRGADRRVDHFDAFAAEDLVEGAVELAVAVCVLQAAVDLPVK